MKINVDTKGDVFWKKYVQKNTVVYLKGYVYSHTTDQLIEILSYLDEKNVAKFINSLDGNFALIFRGVDFSFIAVDKIRSSSIFFTEKNNQYYISCNPINIVDFNKFNKSIISSSILEISMSGYTIGRKTIYKDLHYI